MELKTNKECKEQNRKTGYQYLELEKRVNELINKYNNHINKDGDALGWNLSYMTDTYSKIGEQFGIIGNKLLECTK